MLAAELNEALAALKEPARSVVRRRVLDGDSFAEIGRGVKYSESTVRQMFQRAIADLRQQHSEALLAYAHRRFANDTIDDGPPTVEPSYELSSLRTTSGVHTQDRKRQGPWCDRHGVFGAVRGTTPCLVCHCAVREVDPSRGRRGRSRKYCSEGCRQVAYRERLRAAREADR
ncbi:sigma factor-like helix-turn-helix DNA-binding protein [Nocardia sp. NPDC005978]|uniref:sigma factor-like helix-turn-helix DNA-binding protein n=1 Tax=Nocardia sp. NPDC005978 TaxID=3156725 RepID=UPI0033A8F2C8